MLCVLSNSFDTAQNLKLLSRVRLIEIEKPWINFAIDPSIIIVRNVFHELEIKHAAKLLYEIMMHLPKDSKLLLQDMTTLPKAERGRAGWLGIHLKDILERGGIKTIFTPDTSKTGVDVFLLDGCRSSDCSINEEKVIKLLYEARKEQLQLLKLKYKTLIESPEIVLPILRIEHDITAISIELGDIFGDNDNEKKVVSIFSLAFNNLSDESFKHLIEKFEYHEIKWFQDRSHSIQALDDFLRSGKSIFIIIGSPFIGKKAVAWRILGKLPHNRLPIFINLSIGIDVIQLLEFIAVPLGLTKYLDVDILATLKTLPIEKLKREISKIIPHIIEKVILIFDGFEHIIDPDGRIMNTEVDWLINVCSNCPSCKMILLTRATIQGLPSEKYQLEYLSTFKSNPKGKFGEYLYTVQMLQELIPMRYRLPDNEYAGFPKDLLDSLDNHPQLAYLAAIAIKNNRNSSCLADMNFLRDLKRKLYDNIMIYFDLSNAEKEIIYALTLVKVLFPLKLIDIIKSDNSLRNSLIEKGILLEASPGLFRLLGILKNVSDSNYGYFYENEALKKWHEIFANAFSRLFNESSNPLYYRQSYYHTLASDGEKKKEIKPYNLPELSSCADSWYRNRKYEDVLWAYNSIQKSRILHPRENMRIASCLMRSKKDVNKGKELYKELINKYPDWRGIKSSYIDSLLYIGGCASEALKILLEISKEERECYHRLTLDPSITGIRTH